MNINGFCILKEDTALTLEQALNGPEEAEQEYHAELERIQHKHFPEYIRLEDLDFVDDYTPEGAIEQLGGSFPRQEAQFLDKEHDMINVWKPLVGPNNVWQRALGDHASIRPSDITPANVLRLDRVTENKLLHPNDQYHW
ncbi:MAG: hypothetical protein M1829_005244 [Trizodia sp. TS-e1964]|nr:MAG: hypothetical protein M1829_005244 [Trizodia sp. TS-e1964]